MVGIGYDNEDEKSIENSGFIIIMTRSRSANYGTWEDLRVCLLSEEQLQGMRWQSHSKRGVTTYKRLGVAIIRSDQLTPPQPKVKEGPLLATKQQCVFSVFTPVP